jgi:hypothetical protein
MGRVGAMQTYTLVLRWPHLRLMYSKAGDGSRVLKTSSMPDWSRPIFGRIACRRRRKDTKPQKTAKNI